MLFLFLTPARSASQVPLLAHGRVAMNLSGLRWFPLRVCFKKNNNRKAHLVGSYLVRGPVAKGWPLHLSCQHLQCIDAFAWNSFLPLVVRKIQKVNTVLSQSQFILFGLHFTSNADNSIYIWTINQMTTYNVKKVACSDKPTKNSSITQLCSSSF